MTSGTPDRQGNRTDNRQDGRQETDFGFRRVEIEDHPSLVRAVFDSVAERYDLMNDLMSAGLHRLWKRALIDRVQPRPGMRLIDIAGGTGDIAGRFLDRARARGSKISVWTEAVGTPYSVSMVMHWSATAGAHVLQWPTPMTAASPFSRISS